jgi:ubiquinone/menaquinone biosynthesis C-methylase UbiE
MSQATTDQPIASPMTLMDTAWGFTRTQILKTGVELDVFTHIGKGHTNPKVLAQTVGANERGLRILLNALLGLKVLEKAGEQYQLTEGARTFLSKSSPAYMGEWLLHVSQLMPAWAHLTEIVRSGNPHQQVEGDGDRGEFFSKLVAGLFTMNAPGAQAAAKAMVGQRSGLRILDIGAGSGVWGITFAQQDPIARVTLVDYPKVLAIATQFVAERGLSNRFEYLAGNFREVDFSQNQYDVAILGHICHSEGERNTKTLFQRIRGALRPGGRLLIAEFLVDEERKMETFPLLFAVNMLVNTEDGDTFTLSELRTWLKEAGFKTVETLEAPAPSPLIVATAGD